MKILHICNDFSYSKVYKNLYEQLDMLKIDQIIYHPLRNELNRSKNLISFKQNASQIIYSKFNLKIHHRILFRLKINSLFKDVCSQTDLSQIDMSYATTLFSDGAIAYKLFEKYKIPYIVAVRNTDVNLFLKYRPDLNHLCIKILQNATKIIFISKGLQNKFLRNKIFSNYSSMLHNKMQVISNGIDDIWLNNLHKKADLSQKSIMFVGRFDSNKNLENVILACKALKMSVFQELTLDVVGGGGDNETRILSLIENNKDWITNHGFIDDKNKLITVFRKNNYFVMPSKYETFGLVYIEALSQGLPVLYTIDQGIDGMFDLYVGEATLPDFTEIRNNLEKLLNKNQIDLSKIDFENFRWSNIANKYLEIFKKIK